MCLFCFFGAHNPLLDIHPENGNELPSTDMTFFLPNLFKMEEEVKLCVMEFLVDKNALFYMPKLLLEFYQKDNIVFPLKTGGDGNCLLRAISIAMWGSENWHEILRNRMHKELIENEEFYKQYFNTLVIDDKITIMENDEKDWNQVLSTAEKYSKKKKK